LATIYCWMKKTHRAQPELSIVEKKGMKFYEILDTKLWQKARCISWCTRWARKPHAKKAAVHCAVHSLSRGNLKIVCLDPSLLCPRFTAAVPSTIITRRCVLRSTLAKPWSSTSSMALATVNIDKIIKVTSASSYVYNWMLLVHKNNTVKRHHNSKIANCRHLKSRQSIINSSRIGRLSSEFTSKIIAKQYSDMKSGNRKIASPKSQ